MTTPGLLPAGATNGLFSTTRGFDYSNGWIPWRQLDRISNRNLNHIDATLFSDYAIAGGQPNATSLIELVGGAIGKEINLLSSKRNSRDALTIRFDNRNLEGNPMGFPLESHVVETGWFRIPPQI